MNNISVDKYKFYYMLDTNFLNNIIEIDDKYASILSNEDFYNLYARMTYVWNQ